MKLPHQSNTKKIDFNLKGAKAVIICTSYGTLDKIDSESGEILKVGSSTGVYASEFTEPYYIFQEAQMEVDIASIKGGEIPIDKLSLQPLIRTREDSRYLKDKNFRDKVKNSIPVRKLNIAEYDIVFLSGGWGAAYDFAQSQDLATQISEAYSLGKIIGAVCHGPLGLVNAKKPDGSPLIENVHLTGVTNKQLKELFVKGTPKHPETELKKAGAHYTCKTGFVDMFLNHTEIDEKHRIVTGQNQKAGLETAQNALMLLVRQREDA